jgi:hypothetical protein
MSAAFSIPVICSALVRLSQPVTSWPPYYVEMFRTSSRTNRMYVIGSELVICLVLAMTAHPFVTILRFIAAACMSLLHTKAKNTSPLEFIYGRSKRRKEND